MKRKAALLPQVQERIGHKFSDPSLLERALTHSSAVSAKAGSYQRLEFLGDRVLGLAISAMLLRSFPKAPEGELSRRLADLVRAESCASAARAMQLDAAVQLGSSRSTKTRLTQAILADVCEAVVGAVFLDAGYENAAALIERFWSERMLAPDRPLRDPKTMLQEWAQARGLPTPRPEIPHCRGASGTRARRGDRTLQTCCRAGRGRRHARTGGRDAGRAAWLTKNQRMARPAAGLWP
jgi:ribonuclease III